MSVYLQDMLDPQLLQKLVTLLEHMISNAEEVFEVNPDP